MQKKVSLEDLDSYDQVIVAAGAETPALFPKMSLPVKINKGQLLLCKNVPEPFAKISVIGNGYLAAASLEKCAYLGSTYEHNFCGENPCLETAKRHILKRAAEFIEEIGALRIFGCQSGLRIAHKTRYHPIVERVDNRVWIYTGLGSRGLLYHAYLGKKLAVAVKARDAAALPPEVAITR